MDCMTWLGTRQSVVGIGLGRIRAAHRLIHVAPLVRSGLCSASGVAVTGLSGVSGAGRKASEDYSFCEVDEDLRAYRIGRHQHVPEIEQTVARYAGACEGLSFTPVLVPLRRGILASCVLRLAPTASLEALSQALA